MQPIQEKQWHTLLHDHLPADEVIKAIAPELSRQLVVKMVWHSASFFSHHLYAALQSTGRTTIDAKTDSNYVVERGSSHLRAHSLWAKRGSQATHLLRASCKNSRAPVGYANGTGEPQGGFVGRGLVRSFCECYDMTSNGMQGKRH